MPAFLCLPRPKNYSNFLDSHNSILSWNYRLFSQLKILSSHFERISENLNLVPLFIYHV